MRQCRGSGHRAARREGRSGDSRRRARSSSETAARPARPVMSESGASPGCALDRPFHRRGRPRSTRRRNRRAMLRPPGQMRRSQSLDAGCRRARWLAERLQSRVLSLLAGREQADCDMPDTVRQLSRSRSQRSALRQLIASVLLARKDSRRSGQRVSPREGQRLPSQQARRWRWPSVSASAESAA